MQLIILGLPSLFGTTLFTEIDKTWPVSILVAIHFTVEIGCLFPGFKTHTQLFLLLSCRAVLETAVDSTVKIRALICMLQNSTL